jgi:oligopeptide/dipeptide ABC transporter ATP-binding protein
VPERTAAPLLEVEGLTVSFPSSRAELHAVHDVDLRIDRGEALGLVGESGSGKTMTALAVIGLTPPAARRSARRLRFEGVDLDRLSTREMRRIRGARIGYVPQDPLAALDPVLTVGDQITEPLRMHAERAGPRAIAGEVLRGYGVPLHGRETFARAAALLGGVGISDPASRARQYPHQFSGGMRQRAIIASALATGPSLIVADEPTTALDATVERQVLELLDALREREGMALLLVSHDLGVVSSTCDRVQVLYGGRPMEEGSTAELFRNPRQPYTASLMAATPELDRPPRPVGRHASADSVDPGGVGCPFAVRCPNALPVCRERFPEPTRLGDDHTFWCHNPL